MERNETKATLDDDHRRKILEYIQNLTGQCPHDPSMFYLVFCHRSSNQNTAENNERLEFIGDSVLNLIATDFLYRRYKLADEGICTRARSKLVKGTTLSAFASSISLGDLVVSQTQVTEKTLEDAFEALIGAIYLDKYMGFAKAYQFCEHFFLYFFTDEQLCQETNYKDAILSCQRKMKTKAQFKVTYNDHQKMYTCVLTLGGYCGIGSAQTKKKSEQNAAYIALRSITNANPTMIDELFLNREQIHAFRGG